MAKREFKTQLTPLESAIIKLENAHLYYYTNLLKYGPNLFEVDGDNILQKKDGVTKTRKVGRELIMETLKFYEDKDTPNHYRMCDRLKRVLDDYDKRFPKKTDS